MASHTLDQNAIISTEELKSLASCSGPGISIYLPTSPTTVDYRDLNTRFKSALQRVEESLEQWGLQPPEKENLMEPLRSFLDDKTHLGNAKAIALFRTPDLFRSYLLPFRTDESITVANYFHVAPLLPLLQKPRQFYILALSQKHTRLIRCTFDTSEEVPLPPSAPTNLVTALDLDQPDHVLDNRSAGGQSTGSMKGVMFGTNTDRERKDEYLWHFYKLIDKGLHQVLRGETPPVVVAAVEYELALFHKLSAYPNLLPDGVHGAPDGLKGGELHRRALELVDGRETEALDAALQRYEDLGGTDRTSTDAENIVKAAREGRAGTLLLASETEHGESHDVAALQTILHSGEILVVPRERMPKGSAIAAILRY
jgi:hypothetical protein